MLCKLIALISHFWLIFQWIKYIGNHTLVFEFVTSNLKFCNKQPNLGKMVSLKGVSITFSRMFSVTSSCNGKKNFRKFILHSRGTKDFVERRKNNEFPELPPSYNYGVRETGFKHDNRFVEVPEMIPEIVVPDLKDFKLKAYVSYRLEDFNQPEFTAQDLFIAVYRDKIAKDFKEGKLNEDGSPKEPSAEESLTPEEARTKARQTGSDIFQPRSPIEIMDNPIRY